MKELLRKEYGQLLRLSWKHRLYVAYFILSFALLCVEGNLWVNLLIVVNLVNAARLIKRVPYKELED